jgi:hypothetical protein
MTWPTLRTWLAGEKLTATLLNEQVRDPLKEIGDAWTAYTPTWTATTTNPAIGNGSITGAFIEAGKLIFFRFNITMGSTTTFGSGSYVISLPATSAIGFPYVHGDVTCFDTSASATRHRRMASSGGTTTVIMQTDDAVRVTELAPFTWANGDRLSGIGFYEAA